MAEEEGETLKEAINKLTKQLAQKEDKKFRMPLKAKVGTSKLKKGYVTVAQINENKGVEFTRKPIADGVIKLGDTFHAVAKKDIFYWKGKPLIWQPKGSVNPWNPMNDVNETYGQKYIIAKMKGDLIQASRKKISGMLILILIIAGVAGYYFFSGGAFS